MASAPRPTVIAAPEDTTEGLERLVPIHDYSAPAPPPPKQKESLLGRYLRKLVQALTVKPGQVPEPGTHACSISTTQCKDLTFAAAPTLLLGEAVMALLCQWPNLRLRCEGRLISPPDAPQDLTAIKRKVGTYHWSTIAGSAYQAQMPYPAYAPVALLVYCVRVLCRGRYARLYLATEPKHSIVRAGRRNYQLKIVLNPD